MTVYVDFHARKQTVRQGPRSGSPRGVLEYLTTADGEAKQKELTHLFRGWC